MKHRLGIKSALYCYKESIPSDEDDDYQIDRVEKEK